MCIRDSLNSRGVLVTNVSDVVGAGKDDIEGRECGDNAEPSRLPNREPDSGGLKGEGKGGRKATEEAKGKEEKETKVEEEKKAEEEEKSERKK